MSAVYPPASPDSAFLRQLCAVQGVAPTDADLEAVRGMVEASDGPGLGFSALASMPSMQNSGGKRLFFGPHLPCLLRLLRGGRF